ncbi:sap DNA-binding domain protein [Ichthyophthirius multifiliis]|uniref:Sap DNA-binding domain protein n=1 Tax=Ichthyophthirius multifiliis TaxID=5932 RepID=G0QZB4_ICHMU|nr:sap DNA-binding domain protein [Ichthyophthirius multifiliis]EGR29444.1 sap DNA-binding domain protein [Ichthyophthirius multifiliis]|eukprot:XP_004030680.1 sap DNA-binding domain protein [Ichthyophthirius multifiliis]
MELYSITLYLIIIIISSFVGYQIVLKAIVNDYEIKNQTAEIIYCLIFAFSCNSFMLLIFEVLKIGNDQDRLIFWKLTIQALVYSCIILIPFILIYKIVRKLWNNTLIQFLNIGILYIYFILKLFEVQKYMKVNQLEELLQLGKQIELITMVGTYMIAILSGIGCVECPYYYFNFIYSNSILLQFLIYQLNFDQQKILNNLRFVMKKIQNIQIIKIYIQKYLIKNLIICKKQINKNIYINKYIHIYIIQIYIYKQILDLLIYICIFIQFILDYQELQIEIQRHEYSQTFKGKFFKFLSFIMGIYCIYRIIISIYNYTIGRQKSIDPINRILQNILPLVGIIIKDDDYDTAINYLSFTFLGFLMITSVRTFCINLVNFTGIFIGHLHSRSVDTDIIVYFLAEIVGVYFISTLVLIQYSVAEQYFKQLKYQQNGQSQQQELSSNLVNIKYLWKLDINQSIGYGIPESYQISDKIASFDMDYTLIKTKSGKKFPQNEHDWILWDQKVKTKLTQLYKDGYLVVIFSNQGGVGKGHTTDKQITIKITNIANTIGIPIIAFYARKEDANKKPNKGMWEFFLDQVLKGNTVNLSESFYCGDAAGRKGPPKDFSDSDLKFALNINLAFFTPEQYFLEIKQQISQEFFDPKKLPTTGDLFKEKNVVLKSDKQEMIILIGSAGSGKSTFVYNHLQDYQRINRDELKTMPKCLQVAENAIKNKKNIVIDNTNPTSEARKDFVSLAKKYNIHLRAFVLSVDKDLAMHLDNQRETNKERKHFSKRVGRIPIHTFFKNFQEPTKNEGFDEIAHINFIAGPFLNDKDKQNFFSFGK